MIETREAKHGLAVLVLAGWSLPSFRDVETMFDNRLLAAFGVEPRWPAAGNYQGMGSAGFSRPTPGAFGVFEPNRPVTWAEFVHVLRHCEARSNVSPGSGIVRPTLRQPRGDDAEWVRRVAAGSDFAVPLRTSAFTPGAVVTRAEAVMLLASAR